MEDLEKKLNSMLDKLEKKHDAEVVKEFIKVYDEYEKIDKQNDYAVLDRYSEVIKKYLI